MLIYFEEATPYLRLIIPHIHPGIVLLLLWIFFLLIEEDIRHRYIHPQTFTFQIPKHETLNIVCKICSFIQNVVHGSCDQSNPSDRGEFHLPSFYDFCPLPAVRNPVYACYQKAAKQLISIVILFEIIGIVTILFSKRLSKKDMT